MKDAAGGIFQLPRPRDLSYADIGRHIAKRMGVDARLIVKGSTTDANLPADTSRMHTTLDSSKLREAYGIAASDVLEIIDGVIASAKR